MEEILGDLVSKNDTYREKHSHRLKKYARKKNRRKGISNTFMLRMGFSDRCIGYTVVYIVLYIHT